MTATILLADDHPLVRRGLRHLLDAQPGLHVIEEASDGLEAVHLIEKNKPDIVIVDMMMPNLNGLEVLKQAKHISPDTRVIILSMHSADPYVIEAFRWGASGYVLKDSPPEDLIDAIVEVLEGNHYLSPKLPGRLLNAFELSGSVVTDPYDTLTEREREIYQLVAEGKTALDIAKILSISHRTAESHRGRVMSKFGFHSKAELIRDAVKRGVISLET